MNPRRFYVYIIFDRNGIPRYIGKGTGRRSRQHNDKTRNRRLGMLFAEQAEVPIVIIRQGMTMPEALSLEIALIAAVGRLDKRKGPLFNRTDGGDGGVGRIVSSEERALRQARRGFKVPSPALENMIAANRASAQVRSEKLTAWHASLTEEQRRARSDKISAATRAAMAARGSGDKVRKARSERPRTAAEQAVLDYMVLASTGKGKPRSKAQATALAQMHQGSIGRNHSTETRARMSAAHHARLSKTRAESEASYERKQRRR